MMIVLKWSLTYRKARADELLKAAEKAWIQFEYKAVKTGFKKKPLPLTMAVHKQVEERTFHAVGNHGYKVPKWYHYKTHLSSPEKKLSDTWTMVLLARRRSCKKNKKKQKHKRCFEFKILAAQPSSAMAGESPEVTQGPLVRDDSMWRRWMLDIAGPIFLTPWAGTKNIRRDGKTLTTLKHWILLSVDLGLRQIDACMFEG